MLNGKVQSPRLQAAALIDCRANRSGNMPRVPGQARASGGVTMTLRRQIMPGTRTIRVGILIPWD